MYSQIQIIIFNYFLMEQKNSVPQSSASNENQTESPSKFIGNYKQAPAYMKDNEHITHGYRIGFNTPTKIVKSLFMKHNQVVNIWTHFFPAIFILCLIGFLAYQFDYSNSLRNNYQSGKQKLFNGISNYSQALDSYAEIMKNKYNSGQELKKLEQSLLHSYDGFIEDTQIWKSNLETTLNDFGTSLKQSMRTKITEFQKVKKQFEKQFVPYVLNSVLVKIDHQKLQRISKKLILLKQQLDFETFRHLELSSQVSQGISNISRWPLFVFLMSALICLLGSTTFHLFYPMSGRSYQIFSRLDYAGVNLLIAGSSFPALYYGMYCIPNLAAFYLIFIVAMGSTLFMASLFQYLHRPENLVIKSILYGGYGVSLIIPLSHSVINQVVFNNYGDTFTMLPSIDQYACCGISYLLGLYIYTIRCPERHKPGKYNICGHSHQIWHCLVVLGIIFTYFGALQNLEMRRANQCPVTDL